MVPPGSLFGVLAAGSHIDSIVKGKFLGEDKSFICKNSLNKMGSTKF